MLDVWWDFEWEFGWAVGSEVDDWFGRVLVLGTDRYGSADTDICSWPIFLPIPKPIYLERNIRHQYRYRYFSLAIICPIISHKGDKC